VLREALRTAMKSGVRLKTGLARVRSREHVGGLSS
jgi:hypothetical protein